MAPRLQALHEAVAGTDRAGTAMRRLSKGIVSTVLSDLGTGRRPLAHEALDELPKARASSTSAASSSPLAPCRNGASRWFVSNGM
ncbi:hypothetical protein [Streptomyces mirabilis]|uniref:hypothetical protein n=1 Tax=Streptomyces mirabilis TaxID=68239 RepID=UPI0037FEDDC5